MEFNFSFKRVLMLAACLGIFALLGGFQPPGRGGDGAEPSHRGDEAWSYCVILFVAGAVSASLVEHTIGYMDPTNLRPAYLLMGMLLMLASCVWLRTLKEGLAPPRPPDAALSQDSRSR